MKTQTIEVEGLPEGFEVNTISINAKEKVSQCFNTVQATIHLKKIQPRRIVLEETDENYLGCQTLYSDDIEFMIMADKVWREVKETDIPLTNEDPYLKLNKKDMLELIEHIKLGGQLNPKIAEFIDYEQPEPKLSLSVNDCKSLLSTNDNYAAYHKVQEFIKENS